MLVLALKLNKNNVYLNVVGNRSTTIANMTLLQMLPATQTIAVKITAVLASLAKGKQIDDIPDIVPKNTENKVNNVYSHQLSSNSYYE